MLFLLVVKVKETLSPGTQIPKNVGRIECRSVKNINIRPDLKIKYFKTKRVY